MSQFSVGSLFSGIGGLDLGLESSGHNIQFLSENDKEASLVLENHFSKVPNLGDISRIKSLPKVEILTAGFPCQDISLAGTRQGLLGARSGLVNEVFRLSRLIKPEFIVLENVLNLLRIERGKAMVSILQDLEDLGYSWAYRVVDSRGFGIPQRRLRVVIVASKSLGIAEKIIFSDSTEPVVDDDMKMLAKSHDYGFYWTEGKRGVGWATDAVPPIKGGSGLGIPSAPAVFSGTKRIAGTIDVEDAERLQGFPINWTNVPGIGKVGNRWRLIGNAVSAPLSTWLGSKFALIEGVEANIEFSPMEKHSPLPWSAFGYKDKWFKVNSTTHVAHSAHNPLRSYLMNPISPLSARALAGYIHRAKSGDKQFPVGFIAALEKQLERELKKRIAPVFL